MYKKIMRAVIFLLPGFFLLVTSCEYSLLNITPVREIGSVNVQGIQDVEFSPDGSMAFASICTDTLFYPVLFFIKSTCVASDVGFIDVQQFDMLSRVSFPSGVVLTLAVSPDGDKLITGGADSVALNCAPSPFFPLLWLCSTQYIGGKLVIWDAESEEVETTRLVSSPIESSVFSPDGRYLATKVADGDILIWDTQTWHITVRIQPPYESGRLMSFTQDGSKLIVGCCPIMVIDTDTWEVVRILNTSASDFVVNDLDNELIVARGDDVVLYDLRNFSLKKVLILKAYDNDFKVYTGINKLSLSPDGLFLGAMDNKHIFVWRTGIWEFYSDVPGSWESMKFAKHGDILGCIGNGKLTLWSFEE